MAEDEPGLSTVARQSVDSSSKGLCQPWSDEEITTLIFYLYEHQDKMSGGGDEPGSFLGTYFYIFILLYTSYISLSIFELLYHFHLAFFRLFQIFLIFLYLILVTFIPTLSS